MAHLIDLSSDNDYDIVGIFSNGVAVKMTAYPFKGISQPQGLKLLIVTKNSRKFFQYHGKLSENSEGINQNVVMQQEFGITQPEVAQYLSAIGDYLQNHQQFDQMNRLMKFVQALIPLLKVDQVPRQGKY